MANINYVVDIQHDSIQRSHSYSNDNTPVNTSGRCTTQLVNVNIDRKLIDLEAGVCIPFLCNDTDKTPDYFDVNGCSKLEHRETHRKLLALWRHTHKEQTETNACEAHAVGRHSRTGHKNMRKRRSISIGTKQFYTWYNTLSYGAKGYTRGREKPNANRLNASE